MATHNLAEEWSTFRARLQQIPQGSPIRTFDGFLEGCDCDAVYFIV